MLMLAILTQGEDLILKPIPATSEARRLRQVLGTHRCYVVYEAALNLPIKLDNYIKELDESEVHEFLYGEVYPELEAEGRLTRKNGKYYKKVIT